MLNQIHHVCFAVYNIESPINLMENIYSIKEYRRVKIEERDIEAVLLKFQDKWLEFIAPLSKQSSLFKYLNNKGESFHHIAFTVDSIEKAKQLLPKGAIINIRRSNVGNWTIADLSKKFSLGLSLQLIEED